MAQLFNAEASAKKKIELKANKTIAELKDQYLDEMVDLNNNRRNECAEFVQDATGVGRGTSGSWTGGDLVKENLNIIPGTAIATYGEEGGSYGLILDGKPRMHTAIYLGQDNVGIRVLHQWHGRAVFEGYLKWGGKGVMNGDLYRVTMSPSRQK